MKFAKILTVLMLVVLLTVTAACGGGTTPSGNSDPGDDQTTPSDDSGSDTPAPADEITVTVTAPEGWTAVEPVPAGLLFNYTNSTGASFNGKREKLYEDDLAAYVSYIKPIFEDSFDGLTWEDDRSIQIDGRDAIEINFSFATYGVVMKMAAAYTVIDDDVYYFTFGSMEDGYDSVFPDYESFLNSIKFE